MTQIQTIKHQHALEYWKKIVLDQQASGLNATRYCREKDINYNAFYYWLRAIREDLVKQQPEETTPQFAALSDASTVPALTSNSSGLLLRYGPVSYLNDGHCTLSNNICERAIRNFTIVRKNWLFSDSPKGADASAAAYSIIETCKANGLDPFKYLTFLFETMPNLDFKRHPERIDECLPWNADVQEKCK